MIVDQLEEVFLWKVWCLIWELPIKLCGKLQEYLVADARLKQLLLMFTDNYKCTVIFRSQIVEGVEYPYFKEKKLYFIADVPHLIKNLKSAFFNNTIELHKSAIKIWSSHKSGEKIFIT